MVHAYLQKNYKGCYYETNKQTNKQTNKKLFFYWNEARKLAYDMKKNDYRVNIILLDVPIFPSVLVIIHLHPRLVYVN